MSSWYWPRSACRNCRLPQTLFHTETEFLAEVSAQVEPSTGNDPHRDGEGGRWASTAADLSSGPLRIALTRRVAVLGDRLDEGSRSGFDVAAVGQQDAGILVTRGQLGRNASPVEQGLG
jgi:hypothetical protein